MRIHIWCFGTGCEISFEKATMGRLFVAGAFVIKLCESGSKKVERASVRVICASRSFELSSTFVEPQACVSACKITKALWE